MKSVPLRLNPSVRGELLVELFPSYVASGQRNLALTCRQRPTRNHTARLLCRPPLLPALPAKERPGWPRDGYRFLTWSNSRCRENLLALRRGNGCSSWSRGGGCAGCRSPDGCCCGRWRRDLCHLLLPLHDLLRRPFGVVDAARGRLFLLHHIRRACVKQLWICGRPCCGCHAARGRRR